MRNVFIGSTVRCGGSLLARLFDHHPQVGAYPFELHLPMDEALHPSLAARGEKDQVQNHPRLGADMTPDEVARAVGLDPDPRRCLVGAHFRSGKLRAKSRHLDLDADFDHPAFLDHFRKGIGDDRSLSGVYDALHRALFDTWDRGAHGGTLDFVVYHRANGLFADVGRFLSEFPGSTFVDPVRHLRGCLTSEKRKVLSQLVSGRVARGWRPSDRWVPRATGRFAEATIVNWLVTFTRTVLLKERFGDRVVVYRFEDLSSRPEPTVARVAEAVGVPYHPSLETPTNAGHPWAGNSMFGRQEGINPEMARTRDLLNATEERLLDEYAGPLLEYLEGSDGGLLDFDGLDRGALFDYDRQARYFDDREKTALHFASLYERWRFRSASQLLREAWRGRPRRIFL
ncbi:MAG: sulfotransferase [Myxococcota bacterium]